MKHTPIGAVEVEVDESSVRVEMSHLKHRVVSKNVRHIKAAFHHVLRAASQFELIEFLHGSHAVFIAGEERKPKLGRAKLGAKVEPEIFFREVLKLSSV